MLQQILNSKQLIQLILDKADTCIFNFVPISSNTYIPFSYSEGKYSKDEVIQLINDFETEMHSIKTMPVLGKTEYFVNNTRIQFSYSHIGSNQLCKYVAQLYCIDCDKIQTIINSHKEPYNKIATALYENNPNAYVRAESIVNDLERHIKNILNTEAAKCTEMLENGDMSIYDFKESIIRLLISNNFDIDDFEFVLKDTIQNNYKVTIMTIEHFLFLTPIQFTKSTTITNSFTISLDNFNF